MNRNLLLLLILAGGALAGYAVDYSSLEGKCGAALKEAVKTLAAPHTVISYGEDTWNAFKTCDVREVQGKKYWFDMYSNRLVEIESGHSGMNIEHAVANSWWGGEKNDAYKDLHHLNPSDADANNRKSNNPLGYILGTPSWSNGVSSIGTPMPGIGGGARTVFQPADEYMGDFARAYFYIFTVYDDISWEVAPACMYDLTTYPTLRPWASEMLLEWASSDPVDSREAGRNREVAKVQKNENPFVALPGLERFIWGEDKNTPFKLSYIDPYIRDREAAPVFEGFEMAALNTYTGRWWSNITVTVEDPGDENLIYYSINGEDWKWYDGGIDIPAATAEGETLVIRAYNMSMIESSYSSPMATLTLTAIDPNTTDYKNAEWTLVTSNNDIAEGSLYILTSSINHDVMGASANASSSSGYIVAAGSVTPENDIIKGLPDNAAVVQFESDGGTQFYVAVNDLTMKPKGYLYSTAARKVSLGQQGVSVGISVLGDGTATLNFGSSIGNLQYNAQQPRFSVYTSKQQSVQLYKLVGGLTGAYTPVMIPSTLGAARIFTIDGVEVKADETTLPAGIYIKVTPGGKSTKIMVR